MLRPVRDAPIWSWFGSRVMCNLGHEFACGWALQKGRKGTASVYKVANSLEALRQFRKPSEAGDFKRDASSDKWSQALEMKGQGGSVEGV